MAALRITQVRSANGSNRKQRESLRTLGLGKIGRETTMSDTPQLQGMLRAVGHLDEIQDGRDS